MFDGVATEGVNQLLTSGPLGVAIAILLWYISTLHKERRETEEAHKIEVAAERKLNADLQAARLADQQVLINAAQSFRQTIDTISTKEKEDTLEKLTEQIEKLVASGQRMAG